MPTSASVSRQTFNIAGCEMELLVSSETFAPNATTDKIAREVEVPAGAQILDLGCGVGPLAIYLAQKNAGHVYAVDIVPEACELARQNVAAANLEDRVTVLQGDLFEPVADKKFDVIVNDVSGIAERVARISPWYPKPVPTGGEDGTDVVMRMLDDVDKYLMPSGVLYFATSSLSNTRKIMSRAKQVLGDRLEQLASYRFPFCKELTDAIGELEQLCKEGKIAYEAKRSRFLWTLEVFRARMGTA